MFFRDLLGVLFGGQRYSTEQKPLSEEEIRRLVSQSSVSSLSQEEAARIAQSVSARRLGDGKISLAQIDETLRELERKGKISDNDRKGVMQAFQKYLGARNNKGIL